MHPIVDELRVSFYRDTLTRRVQEHLIRYCILEIAELITFVSKQLDESDSHVRRSSLDPIGIESRDHVEQEPPEAGVVLGQIIDQRFLHGRRRADCVIATIRRDWATNPEVNGNDRQLRIEIRNSPDPLAVHQLPSEAEGVFGIVPLYIERDLENRRHEPNVLNADADDACAADDMYPVEVRGKVVRAIRSRVGSVRERLDEMHDKDVLVRATAALELDVRDPIQRRVRENVRAAL